jgi:hypothetical protein
LKSKERALRFSVLLPALVGAAVLLPIVLSTSTARTGASPPLLLFGLGPTADGARDSRLNREAPLDMYTTWYNRPSDLGWMAGWENGLVPQVYASGTAMHLVIWNGDAETGTPCGRQYPIGSTINADMVRLAQIFGGDADDPPLYVTLFTEFQTFPCTDNQWSGAEAYYTRLQTKMIEIRDIFHQHAPNSLVSIGWGGWQVRWSNSATGAGRALFPHFHATMRAMDYQSFQAMATDTNVNDVRAMTQTLGAYGPVMLAHHKPNGFYPAVFSADLSTMMTDAFISEMNGYGLFAWSFMDQREINSSEAVFQQTKSAVLAFSGEGCTGPACAIDSDGDGCSDAAEAQAAPGSETSGGRRDPGNPWDFFDVPAGAPPARDGIVSVADLVAVIERFGSSGSPGGNPFTTPPAPPAYHAAYDRGGVMSGGQLWNLSPANGSINITDVVSVIAQFGHSCR